MSDILRSAVNQRLTTYPLRWRKDAPDHWSAEAGTLLTASAWPSRMAWKWEVIDRATEATTDSGATETRRLAMDAAEAAARTRLPVPTDVQVVTGWLALQGEVPGEVLAAALRLAERDKDERRALTESSGKNG